MDRNQKKYTADEDHALISIEKGSFENDNGSSKEDKLSCILRKTNEDLFSLHDDEILMEIFDFLIPDWRFRNVEASTYDLIVKKHAIKKLTKICLVEHLLSLLKCEKKAIFHHVVYSILLQLIYENFEAKQRLSEFPQELDKLESYLKGIHDEYFQHVFILLSYHLKPEKHQNHEYGKSEILDLLEYLKSGCHAKFEKLFKKLMNEDKVKFGSYYKVSFKPWARFMYFIATAKNLSSAVEMIFRLFPNVNENFCLVTSFHEQRNMWIFKTSNKYNLNVKNIRRTISEYKCNRLLKAVHKSFVHYRVFNGILDLDFAKNIKSNFDDSLVLFKYYFCLNLYII